MVVATLSDGLAVYGHWLLAAGGQIVLAAHTARVLGDHERPTAPVGGLSAAPERQERSRARSGARAGGQVAPGRARYRGPGVLMIGKWFGPLSLRTSLQRRTRSDADHS